MTTRNEGQFSTSDDVPPPPELEYVMTLILDLDGRALVPVDRDRQGYVLSSVAGGSFEGPRLAGRVLPGGVSTLTRRSGRGWSLDGLLFLETHTGSVIRMTERGLLPDSSAEEVHTVPRFDVGPGQHDWLARAGFVGVGRETGARRVVCYYRVK